MKYLYVAVIFQEIPDEITLGISISNCQIKCNGCNQPDLWSDTGDNLTVDSLNKLINRNVGITCVCFMGSGNREYQVLNTLAKAVKEKNLKVGLYLGEDEIPEELDLQLYDYIKIGHWDASKGGLNNSGTNQVLYKLIHTSEGIDKQNINYKLQRHENQSEID